MPAARALTGPGQAAPGQAAPGAVAAARPAAWAAMLAGGAGMVSVGGSVAVSSVLAGAPFCTAEALRYGIACLLLVAFSRAAGQRVVMPRRAEWLWLSGIAVTGLAGFNMALVQGSRHAEPAVLGVAVACVPSLLAVIGPLLARGRPEPAVVAAAVVVTCGAVMVQGLGRADAAGVGYATVVLGCEAAFTLLAVPVLGRHGAWGVSVHTTWLATVMFAGVGLVREGPAAVTRFAPADWLAVGYLAVAVTAVAFLLWYTSVRRLGAGRAGLLTGVAPVAAAVSGVLLGGPPPRPLVWAGIAVLAAGLALGLRAGSDGRGGHRWQRSPRWPGGPAPAAVPAAARRPAQGASLRPGGGPRSPTVR